MTCRIHAFCESVDGTLLYCERCGAVRSLMPAAKPPRPPKRRRAARADVSVPQAPEPETLFDRAAREEEELLSRLELEQGIDLSRQIKAMRENARAASEDALIEESNAFAPRIVNVEDELDDELPTPGL